MEWKQITPFLGWQDYMATGQPDLSLAFMEQMYDRTMYKFMDNTTVLATNKMGQSDDSVNTLAAENLLEGT